jgi:hypothetical protein
MAMQPVYLVAVGNLSKFLEALRHAQAPEKLNLKFVEELGFRSTNDRLFIPLLKAMKFVDEGGKPTSRYHAFLDDTQWKRVLADGVRDAYPDLFRVNRQAQTLTREQLAGKIRSLSEGKFSTAVVNNTAKTFLELAKLSDWTTEAAASVEATEDVEDDRANGQNEATTRDETSPERVEAAPTLVYRIEIVLPAVRDQAVYDAIFQSARKHLLR